MPKHQSTTTVAGIVFSTTNPFGGTVTLESGNWTGHVLVSHPELIGKEAEVQAVVESPDQIRESTLTNKAVIYEGGTSSGLLRVVVYSDDPSKALAGSDGAVGSAFPRDVVKYPSPHVGNVVWTRPVSPISDDEGGK